MIENLKSTRSSLSFVVRLPLMFFFHSKISRYKTMTQERKLLYLVLWGYMDST